MFMSPGNLITHRQKRWKKGGKVQEQIDKFEGQVYNNLWQCYQWWKKGDVIF